MRSRAVWVCGVLVGCALLYLTSAADRATAQDRAATATRGDENRPAQVESAAVEGKESEEPIQFVPLPPDTVFEQHTVMAEGAHATAGAAEQLVYSNTLGTFAAALGANRLVSDDITTSVPGNCALQRYVFDVIGKVAPGGTRGAYTVDFAMYSNCPAAVPSSSVQGLVVSGTQGQAVILDQCLNATDNDGDSAVNDGCGAVGPAETDAQCLDATDDDGDGKINDGCPAVGPPESDADIPRRITFIAGDNVQLPTNMWFGVKFSRSNAGVVVGTPPFTGFSCDQYSFPGLGCNTNAGGFPDQPQASFNLEIYADAECTPSYTAYKNNNPGGSLFNPGTNIFLADDIQLSNAGCNMIAYEVAVRGQGFYEFQMSQNCESGVIAGTEGNFSVFGTSDVKIARITIDPPIPLPQNFWFEAKVNNDLGSVVISGQQACIGTSADLLQSLVQGSCNIVLPVDIGEGIHGAFSLAITCAGPAPVGACCDMILTDENNDAVCRQLPKTNCPYPERDSTDRPEWVEGQACEPDPFSPQPCGVAACCTPDGDCHNLTLNECNAFPPVGAPRQWQRGRYCNSELQRCPRIPCLERAGECTTPRCTSNAGDCDTTMRCVGGLNAGGACTTNANCRVCSNKKCSGSPANTICTGTGQGTCPVGQTCNFITCTDATPCLGGTCPTGGTCGPAPNICTAGLIGKPCSFDSQCHCPGSEINGVLECQVGPTCCDGCPPVGCRDAFCCTNVCDIDIFCCDVEWDQSCADRARLPNVCNIRPANDVCAPQDPLLGARLMTTSPPTNTAESDHGRATEHPDDPGFGCYVGDPGKKGLQTIWYKFFATHETTLLQTCASNSPATDSLLAVFAVGDSTSLVTECNSLIPVGCNDDFAGCSSSGKNSKLCVRTVPGELYYVMVAAKVALLPGKAYRLDISAPCPINIPPPPLGDFCPDAQSVSDGNTAFDLGNATMTAPIETCTPPITGVSDKWYDYTATCSGVLSVEACGTIPGTTTNLAIYEECLCPPIAGPPIGCRSAIQGPICGPGFALEVDVIEGGCYGIRFSDDADNRPSGNLEIACTQADCPAGQFTFTEPPDGVVDAARPHDPNDPALLQGIQTIKATGPRDALQSCFTLCETASSGVPNSIANIAQLAVEDPPGTFTYKYTINLTRPITPGALTTITYTDAHSVKSTGRFTSHPGNVNADALTLTDDVNNLFALLNGVGTPVWDDYSRDINRSGLFTPADLLEEIDLMTDDGPYDPPVGGWDGSLNQSTNPTCP